MGNLVGGSALEYKVKVAQKGKYKVEVSAVSGNSNSNRQLSLYAGSTLLTTLNVINKTDWEDFQKVSAIVNFDSAGEQTIKLTSTGSVNISDIVFTKVDDSTVETTKEVTTAKPTEQPTTVVSKGNKRVVGYLPSYRTSAINSIDFSALTHCCLSFMTYANGTLTSGFSDSTVQTIVNKCHANNVKALIAIGGGSGFNTSDNPFGTAAKRTSFVNQIMTYVDRLNLDGVDIDIEVTDSNTWSNFDAMCSELSGRLKAEGKLLTMAVSSWFTDPIQNSTYNYFDFVNLMTYDAAFGDGPVAPMSQITNMVNYYGNRGISKERMTIGVPFYGYSSGAKDYTYSQIIAMDANNKNLDYYNGIYYNGEKTIREKAELSKDYGGIMIWELGQDSFGSNSLLAAIKDVMQKETVVTVSDIPGTIPVNTYSDKSSAITMNTDNNVTYAGNLNDGLYLSYMVSVAKAGDYTINLKLAAGDAQYNAKNMIVKLDGNTIATIPVQASSTWTTFVDHSAKINLSQTGKHTLTIMAEGGACNVADFSVENYKEETTVAPTEAPTTAPKKAGIEINGYQISTTVKGHRVVYSVSDPNKEIVSSGLVYGVANYATAEDMVVGSSSKGVMNYQSTDIGKCSVAYSDMEDAQSYTMTMQFVDSVKYYSDKFMVRAYAQLKDGTYVYSNVENYTIYSIADILYQNRKMNTVAGHNFLYEKILLPVNPAYKIVDYDWGNIIVGA